jgi:hypothetical protein
MRTDLLRFNGAVGRDPAIDAWMKEHAGELGAIAHQWFEVMRKCGVRQGRRSAFLLTRSKESSWRISKLA